MIQLTDLKKTYDEKTAVDIPEFTIHDGDMLGLVGNNGAGKTTLFRLILDLLKADCGRVGITLPHRDADAEPATINPAESEEWKNFTGAYIDEGFLIDFLTPEEYFAFIGKVNNMDETAIAEREKDFERFMAGEIMGQKKLIRDYSAGNKQKIGIISALFNRPQVVILDEPFNFLDPSSQNILKKLLTNYHDTTGATILISSHNLQHTVDISTRVALLEHGHILRDIPNLDGSAEQVLKDYFDIKEA